MHDDFAWLTEHSLEIHEKYAGKWIAILDGDVVGVGETATEAATQAEARHPSAAFLFAKVERDLDTIYPPF